MILSCFPGIGLLDRGFEAEGFVCVRGPDVIWGGDIRTFHPPAGVFDGVIGGDPCQSHSALANLVRAKGLEPSFPDMTPELCRVIEEARPRWFLRENVPRAPAIKPLGYDVRSFLLDHSTLDSGDGTGHEQMRRRRFWFGTRDVPCPELRAFIDFALFVLAGPLQPHRESVAEVCGDARETPVALGGSGKVKPTRMPTVRRASSVTGRHAGEIGATGGHVGHPPRYSLAEMLRLQGLPEDYLDHCPMTMQGKRKAIGNGVPVGMGRALARAIACAIAAGP